MKSLLSRVCSLASAAVMALAMCGFGANAWALDKVTLKDGRVIEGTITREESCCVWIKSEKNGLKRDDMFLKDEVKEILRDATATATPVPTAVPATAPIPGTPAAPGAPQSRKAPQTPEAAPAPVAAKPAKPAEVVPGDGTPKAAIITLGDGKNDMDMVGVYMTKHALDKMLPMLEEQLGKDRTGVVVFRVSSGGGYLYEIQRMVDVIHKEYKPRFRVVGWIESAISAAAMTSHILEEIYFTPQGNYGACTGFTTLANAVEGFDLEKVLGQMEQISALSGKNPLIMKAMQVQVGLSASIDENGDVRWFEDDKAGDIKVNDKKNILTFNERTAREVKFSKGTASTLDELQTLMGYQELEWVGEKVKNVPWPVSKAEKWNVAYRKQVKDDQDNLGRYRAEYNMQLAAAEGTERAERGKFVNRARDTLNKMVNMVRNSPNIALFNFNMDAPQFKRWTEEQDKLLRDLMR